MGLIGISLGGDFTARWLEDHSSAVDCVEIAAEGFFARPSPYLRWLASRFPLVFRASGLSIGTTGPLDATQLTAFEETNAAARARFIVHPLGFTGAGEVHLYSPVPINLSPASLAMVRDHLTQATALLGAPALVEPITAALRVPGSMAETEFLVALCRTAGCRLFIDVTTLLVSSRNHGIHTGEWLRALPGDLIAGARIGGVSLRDGRWHVDAHGAMDEAAWALMADLMSHARPEIMLLGAHRRSGDVEEPRRNLERLRHVGEGRQWPRDVTPASVQDATSPTATAGPTPAGVPPASQPGPTDGGVPARTDRPGIAGDVALFVLDDEGVFFSESRHELSLFNTAATLAWCLLEDGLSVPEMTKAYRDALGLEEAEAARHLGTILQHWFGLGHLTAPASLTGEEMPLTTALAMVLTNPRLRAQFRQSPAAVADVLHVAREEVAAFIALDPDELDAQAEEVALYKSAWLGGTNNGSAVPGHETLPEAASRNGESQQKVEVPAATSVNGHSSPTSWQARYYRLLTTTFAIRAGADDGSQKLSAAAVTLRDRIHEALAHLECPDVPEPDITLTLGLSSRGGWTVFEDDEPIAECRGTEDVVPVMKLLLREMAVNRHPFLMSVHAGVVSFGDGCVLLPASAGSGKTTLTAALIRAGATYFSDEIALLEEGTLAVRPVPLALTIKEGSVAPLRTLYPEIDTLAPHVREDYVRVRYLTPPRESLPLSDEPQPVRWIVFPRYTERGRTELCPLSRPAALRRLLDESFLPLEQLDRGKVEALVQWMRTVECFELPLSSLDEAVPLMRELMQRPADPTSIPETL
ncbi:MAG: DUF692 family protein [Acidobacteria bacterium]|nr:DUF692 family protein [Acidobacteriota bacterium]